MSLIQEALRRQQEDDQPGASAGADPRENSAPVPEPETPAPAKQPTIKLADTPPPPPPPEANPPANPKSAQKGSNKKSSRTWATLIGVVLLIVLVLGGALWMLWFAYQRVGRKSMAEFSEAAMEAVNTMTPPSTVPEPTSVALPPPQEETAPVAQIPVPKEPLESAHPVADKPIPVPPEGTPSPTPPASPAVEWPSLTLEGIVGKGSSGAAIINGEIFSVGETTEGATLVSIERNGVTFEFKGERQLVKVNRSSNP